MKVIDADEAAVLIELVERLKLRRAHRRRPSAPALELLAELIRSMSGQSAIADSDGAHDRPMPLLLTLERVADELGEISVSTVKRLIRDGALPAVKVNGSTRVRAIDLENYVAGLLPKPTTKEAA